MNVKVTVKEYQVTEYTYEIEGASSLAEAEEAAMKCYRTHFAPLPCHLYRTVPHPIEAKIGKVEIN